MYLRHRREKDKEEYHFPQCGLDNVYLLSGYEIKQDEQYGPLFSVRDADELFLTIGVYLATEKKRLCGKEIRYLRLRMDLSQAALGQLLRVSDQQVARWEKEQNAIPGPADALLRYLYLEAVSGKCVSVRALLEGLDALGTAQKRKPLVPAARKWKAPVTAA